MAKTDRATGKALSGTLKGSTLWVALAGCAILVGLMALRLAESEAPLVDMESRDGETVPLHPATDGEGHLRFAVATMVSAEATFSTYSRLVARIGRDVGREETFVLRPSYADVRHELEKGNVDVAFVCTGTYVHSLSRGRIKLLAQPEFKDGLEYRSLLIVPARSKAQGMDDLRGSVIAFTDPESNTGCLVPSAELARAGHDPKTYFDKVIFTGSHDRSIQAVATATVGAATVDSLVWESNLLVTPSLTDRVRVIWQSEPFGPPPIVVPQGIDEELERSLRTAFLGLHEDEDGRRILSAIGISRFVIPRPGDYASAIELYKTAGAASGGLRWP
jgi:phosphate/phosphite/phosphonate ABC transporter binding protein